ANDWRDVVARHCSWDGAVRFQMSVVSQKSSRNGRYAPARPSSMYTSTSGGAPTSVIGENPLPPDIRLARITTDHPCGTHLWGDGAFYWSGRPRQHESVHHGVIDGPDAMGEAG